MSQAYNANKKAKRRAKDEMNPERKRIRNQIKAGILPRWKAQLTRIVQPLMGPVMDFNTGVFKKTVVGRKSRTEWKLVSVFALLTAPLKEPS